MKGKLIFKEVQSFRNSWVMYVVVGVAVLILIGGIFGVLYGNDPQEAVIGMIITGIVSVGLVAVLAIASLHTYIDENTIYYRFPPFVNHERTISKEGVKEIYVRKYKPIWEYGGYGYRYRFRSGRALNVAGNQGLQIILSNDKRLLLGTQKPEEMQRAVRRLKENWNLNG